MAISERFVYPSQESELDYCPWCKKSEGLTYLELYSLSSRVTPPDPCELSEYRSGFLLSYPGNGPFVAYVSHNECGPDTGYAIPLADLRNDPAGWKQHLREKMWNCSALMNTINYLTRNAPPPHPIVPDRLTSRKPKSPAAVKRTPAPRRPVKTYFIQSEAGGHVKIGKSSNPENRLRTFQTSRADRLALKRILDGDREGEFHRRFRHLRVQGEWFRCEDELARFLEVNPG